VDAWEVSLFSVCSVEQGFKRLEANFRVSLPASVQAKVAYGNAVPGR
jgi:hypothetical protein